MQDFYKLLGVTKNSSPEEIRSAWRKKVKEHHPDLGGDQEEFLKIMHAYKMLTDPSYYLKQSNTPVKDLTFRVQLVMSFEECFYGTTVTVNYNRIELDDSLQPMKSDFIEPISLPIEVPPGSNNGQAIKKKKMGMKHQNQIGDLIVKVIPQRHKRYSVRNHDVIVEEKVPLHIMLKGGEITVETLWGHRVIWIPPGTNPETQIKIPECGVKQKGFQICIVRPVFPKSDELKGSSWHGLNINWDEADKKQKEDEEIMRKYEELKK